MLSNVETPRARDVRFQRSGSEINSCGPRYLGDSGWSRSTKEASQPPVRAKVGATLVPGRKSESIMKADLIAAASEVITNQQILVNMVSRRVRQLSLGHRPLVEYAPGLREADIALTEIANGKLTFESTFGQNGTGPVPHVVQFPEAIVAKKAVTKKKAA
jgi:DNA-directed RNA polymerase subunit omega